MSGKYKLEGENAKIAINMLEAVTRIFEDVELKYVLDCGTLLGIYREDRLLPWDNDMDLSIFCDDEKRIKNVIKKIKKAGFLVKIRYQEKEDYPLEFKK
ncbi:MAG: LicD family protein [Candidatus Marinimicrobia bacterium]|nr:LicD family protein [Candidatus Neomarinimicrobiota bacterium]